MKKARFIAIVLVLTMVLAVVLAACNAKEFTVTYIDSGSGATVGTETVKKGETASGRVSGYVLNSNLKTADGKVFDLDTPITEDIELYGAFIVTTSWLNDTKNYTYRMAASDLPKAWNSHTYEAAQATYVLDYTTDSLYTMDYNATKDGYVIIPGMASGDPVDVTSQYVGQFGIKSGETGKAYSIPLKTNLRYDDGSAINANSFVRSMQLLLNPEAANFRADNMWKSGNLKIYGSENYTKQNSTTYEDITADEGVWEEETWGEVPADVAATLYFSAKDCYVYNFFYANGYVEEGDTPEFILSYFLCEEASEEDIASLNGKTLAEILADDGLNAILEDMILGWCTIPGEEFGFFCESTTWGSYNWSDVGFLAPDDYHLVVVLKNAMEDNFYLRYELCTDFFLVNNALYESCIDTSSGVYTNSFGTSVATYSGNGPYKLVEYIADSTIKLVRNEFWRGYFEEDKAGLYQTTGVSFTVVTDDATRLEMFLKGEIDSYGLRAADMADYLNSKYTYFNDSESTWFVAMNPQEANLNSKAATATAVTAGNTVIKAPLVIDEFRQAMSYSLNRQEFISTLNPTSAVAKALLSSVMIDDPDAGTTYRNTDEAKDAILKFWGLSDAWGEGKEYATRDEAIESITGYNPTGATTLFTQAYEKAVAAGYIPSGNNWELQIIVGASNWGSAFYSRGYDYLAANWSNAVKGTPWEGHLSFKKSGNLGDGFGDALKKGDVDLLFGVGFSGSMFDPYSFMDVFTGELAYDAFTDKTKVDMDVVWNGQTLRASLFDWVLALQGDEITTHVVTEGTVTETVVKITAGVNDPAKLRLAIMAEAEVVVMRLSNMIPLMTDASASLRCMRINYYTEEYILGVGRGGLKYYTYSYSDEEFAAFVQQQGGTLDYTVTE